MQQKEVEELPTSQHEIRKLQRFLEGELRSYAREARIDAESYQLATEQEQQELKFYQLQARHLRVLEKGA